jgi:DNA polymerase III alpha subunit
MINLRVRSEYSFRFAYGKLHNVVAKQEEFAAITDRGNTFGHVPFYRECKKQNKKPILGVELSFCENPKLKVKQNLLWVTFLAKNQEGLAEIYRLVSLSTKYKYYENRLGFEDLESVSDNLIIIIEDAKLEKYAPNAHYGVSPLSNYSDYNNCSLPKVAISDNLYCNEDEKDLYEIILGKGLEEYDHKNQKKKVFTQLKDRLEPSHILTEDEWKKALWWLEDEEAIKNTKIIADQIESFDLRQAQLPDSDSSLTLKEMCLQKAEEKNLMSDEYLERLNREIEIIEQKDFANYFFIVADLVNYAKKHMLVGPARGSSAGSLVCYLLGITEVDPIRFGLLFERFLDLNKADLPDIDIDFPDTERHKVFSYMQEKYGEDCVATLGVISQYKPRSILTETAKILGLKQWQIKDLKEAVPETDAGDQKHLLESIFRDTQIGRSFAEKYPALVNSEIIEGHARHHGQHPAAVLVSKYPLTNYSSIDSVNKNCQIDKNDAEYLNLLKIDCLSVSTLTTIKNCLDEIGKDRDWLLSLPLNDQAAFDVINDKKYYGIFQFEGDALISVAKQFNITDFNDLVAITSLARPGTLINGEANRYAKNKSKGIVEYAHKILEPILKETYGIIVYQEQVMRIVKEVGNFSWEDTSKIRKAVGKSMGSDFINKMKPLFIKGCQENNVDIDSANAIWKNILDMGSYTFNKSHAVSYAMLSYWCLALKAYHPLEFALATLKSSSQAKITLLLRELVKEGYEYKAFDKNLSEVDWSIKEGKLIGGLINIKGIGETKALEIIERRSKGKPLTAGQERLLYDGETPYDSLFEFKDKFKQFYSNWKLFLKERPCYIKDIRFSEEVRFLAKSIIVKQKDINDPYLLEKREGKRIEIGPQKFVDILFADDTDSVKCRIARENYEELGASILDDKVGTYYIVLGKCCSSFKFVFIYGIKKITIKDIERKLLT